MNGKNQNFDMLKLKFLGAKISFYTKVSTLLVKVHTKIMDASTANVKEWISIMDKMEFSVPDELRQTIDSFTK